MIKVTFEGREDFYVTFSGNHLNKESMSGTLDNIAKNIELKEQPRDNVVDQSFGNTEIVMAYGKMFEDTDRAHIQKLAVEQS